MSGWALAWAANSDCGGYRRSSRKSVSIACPSVGSDDIGELLLVDSVRGLAYASTGLAGDAVVELSDHSGPPTGSTGRADIPLTTPAADAYHATSAVSSPTYPPTATRPLPAALPEKLP